MSVVRGVLLGTINQTSKNLKLGVSGSRCLRDELKVKRVENVDNPSS